MALRKPNSVYGNRIVLTMTEHDFDLWKKYVPWGLTTPIGRAVLGKVMQAIEEHGKEFCMALVEGRFKIVPTEKQDGTS